MKNTQFKLTGLGNIVTGIALLSLFTISSCTKKTDTSNDGAKFVGTWVGTSTCNPGATQNFIITAGSDGNTVNSSGTVGGAGCVKSATLIMKASGNVLTLNSQTFTDNCGLTYTLSGSGSINGNSFTMTQTATGAVNATCTFTGSK